MGDLSMLAQQATFESKRHGGRHLRRSGKPSKGHGPARKLHKHGKKHGKGGKRGCQGGKHHHGGCGKKWIIGGAVAFAGIAATFLGFFKKFAKTVRRYQLINDLHEQSANLSVTERNKKFQEMKKYPCKWAMRKQMKMMARCHHQLVERCKHRCNYQPPSAEVNQAYTQHVRQAPVAQPQQPAEPAPVARFYAPEERPVVQPQETTYTLDQVKDLLAIERVRMQDVMDSNRMQ